MTHGWGINLNSELNKASKSSTPVELPINAWKSLLADARHLTVQMTDADKVERCLQDVHTQLGEVVQKTIIRLDSRLGGTDLWL